ncbi:MAG: glycosyltransferase family 4 protein [Gemmatimonadetes bacterium]|nr:glycosyltransferase family 4 protein [Gemmatimonadota bacterium]
MPAPLAPSTTLRLLHIDAGREWRGGQRQVFLLARGQRERGSEPLVIAQADSPLVKRLRASGMAASAMRMRGDWDLGAARRLRAHIKAWRPDIVHAHDARSHALAMVALLGLPRIPLVVTRRVAFVPRGRLKYGRRVSRFIAISQAVRNALVTGGVSEDRIDVVYSGVPAQRPEAHRDWRTELGWPPDAVICGLVGAMTSEKGTSLLEEITRQLSPTARSRCRLVLLGGRGAGLEEVSGVPCYRAGFVDAIGPAVAGLDVLWHPSAAEGLGTSVIDAMALRVPPVAFAVGGLPELIASGESGLLVPPGDVTAFASAASQLIEGTELRQALGSAGPGQAARFGVEAMVEGNEAVYRAVLAAQTSGAVRG